MKNQLENSKDKKRTVRLGIYGLAESITGEDLGRLLRADGRQINNVGRTKYQKIGIVDAEVETARELVSIFHNTTFCGFKLNFIVFDPSNRRRRKRRRTNEARKEVMLPTKIKTSSKEEFLIASAGGSLSNANVFTSSKFYDPREKVAKGIRESLNSTKAPKLVYEWYAEPKKSNEPFSVTSCSKKLPGFETTKVMRSLELKNSFMTRLKKRAESKRAVYKGLTSCFSTDTATPPKRAAHRAEEFLKSWLDKGPRPKKDIIKDAQRDNISITSLYKARKKLGCVTKKVEGVWMWFVAEHTCR